MTNARRGTAKQDASGRWYATVDVAPQGAPRKQIKKRGFATKGEAQNWINSKARAAADGLHVDASKMIVGEWLDKWLEGQKARLRPTTLDAYERLIETHVKPRIGAARLQSLTADDLDRMYAEMMTSGRLRGAKMRGAGVSARTTRFAHTVIRKALADAVMKGHIARNVADAATPPSHSAAKAPESKAWSPEDLRAFLGHDAVRDHDLVPLFVLAGTTGMRRGELCGATWSDVDLDAGTLYVRQQVTALRGVVTVGPVKTARSRRRVDLDPRTVAVLRNHRVEQLEARVLIGAGWRDHDLLFPTVDGSPRHPDTVTTAFARLVKTTGLSTITFHGLRHSHASHMIEAGQHTKHIADRLGHASASFTLDRYGHSSADGLARAAQATASLVWGDRPILAVLAADGDRPEASNDS